MEKIRKISYLEADEVKKRMPMEKIQKISYLEADEVKKRMPMEKIQKIPTLRLMKSVLCLFILLRVSLSSSRYIMVRERAMVRAQFTLFISLVLPRVVLIMSP